MKRHHHYLWLKWFSGCMLLVAAIWAGQTLQRLDLSWLEQLKHNTVICVLLVLSLFILKALTVIFIPSSFLYLVSGLLFPAGTALVLVLFGLSCEYAINFYMGKTFGRRQVRRLTAYIINRHDKLHHLASKQLNCSTLTIFLLRFLPGPPNTVTSLLLGSSKVSFLPYFWPSLLGTMPKATAVTIAGAAMLNPLSWQFLLPNGLFGIVVVIAILWYRRHHSAAEQLASEESPDDR